MNELHGGMPVGLFPNLTDVPQDAVVMRLGNGSRVVARLAPDGTREILRYLHGPDRREELDRLGLRDEMVVRIRQEPENCYGAGPYPPVLEELVADIPEDLRGRVGTLRNYGSGYKNDPYVAVVLHRRHPRDPRQTLSLPMIWLEPAPDAGIERPEFLPKRR